jgi:hypothetical protein
MTESFDDELAKCSVRYTENLVAEREALIAELARCNASLETAVGANAMWKRLHDEAQAELARCKQDAERYRWLQDESGIELPQDDAIDAALKGEKL